MSYTTTDTVNWLYAIETAANDAMEIGDLDAQEFFLEWFVALRDYDFSHLAVEHKS